MSEGYEVSWGNRRDVSCLLGKTLTKIVHVKDSEDDVDGECIYFYTTDGEVYKLYHEQDCCEYVHIEDICGSLEDLVNSPITLAEEVGGECGEDEDDLISYTWTFYKFATQKGYVDIRWYGESNGYYSESVNFGLCTKGENDE